MFENKSFFEIINMGGFTLYLIFILSVISLAIIIERVTYFRKISQLNRGTFIDQIKQLFKNHELNSAISLCKKTDMPLSRVIHAGLEIRSQDEKSILNSMERQIKKEVVNFERYTEIIGSIGGTVVYIGLFGTVLGIIKSFHEISLSAAIGGGLANVITGIAEALICTASGIAVAVPSVIAYNLLFRKISTLQIDLELAASEVSDLLRNTHELK